MEMMFVQNVTSVKTKSLTSIKNRNVFVIEIKQENAIRCNNRDDLFYLTFTLKIWIFSEAYI